MIHSATCRIYLYHPTTPVTCGRAASNHSPMRNPRSKRRRKKKPLPPRVQRMDRKARLQSARHWLAGFGGKNIVRSYRKRYAVDLECALKELEMLGVAIDPTHAQKLRASAQARIESRRRRAEAEAVRQDGPVDPGIESDDVFAYIAGTTAGGLPFGVSWDELGEEDWEEQDERRT